VGGRTPGAVLVRAMGGSPTLTQMSRLKRAPRPEEGWAQPATGRAEVAQRAEQTLEAPKPTGELPSKGLKMPPASRRHNTFHESKTNPRQDPSQKRTGCREGPRREVLLRRPPRRASWHSGPPCGGPRAHGEWLPWPFGCARSSPRERPATRGGMLSSNPKVASVRRASRVPIQRARSVGRSRCFNKLCVKVTNFARGQGEFFRTVPECNVSRVDPSKSGIIHFRPGGRHSK
jgi:hypothetical protein